MPRPAKPRVRRTALLREGGPYRVISLVDGSLSVWATWANDYGKPAWRRRDQADQETAGGPGMFSRVALADHLERWLNWPYDEAQLALLNVENGLMVETTRVSHHDLKRWRDDPAALDEMIQRLEKREALRKEDSP